MIDENKTVLYFIVEFEQDKYEIDDPVWANANNEEDESEE